MVLASIILAIAIGVTNIALKEINFSTSGQATNDAFFAADTGAECALYWDKGQTVNDPFPDPNKLASMTCVGEYMSDQDFIGDATGGIPAIFSIFGLGSSGNSCALITVLRTTDSNGSPITQIVSKGYNNGYADDSAHCVASPNSVERELDVNYQ